MAQRKFRCTSTSVFSSSHRCSASCRPRTHKSWTARMDISPFYGDHRNGIHFLLFFANCRPPELYGLRRSEIESNAQSVILLRSNHHCGCATVEPRFPLSKTPTSESLRAGRLVSLWRQIGDDTRADTIVGSKTDVYWSYTAKPRRRFS
jgi:hypothetical protein